MFLKAVLTFLAVGALSVSAMTIPVARSPAPEPESQELEAWMLKRGLSYDLLSRELQALDELFSREPEDGAEWAGFARAPQDNKKGQANGAPANKSQPKKAEQGPYSFTIGLTPVRTGSW